MKYIFIPIVFAFPIFTFASIQSYACKDMKNIRTEMSIIASNIANLNTTRTPYGGPYSRKEFVCSEKNCEVKEYSKILKKYQPRHPGADKAGYVSYPDIDINQEVELMLQASRNYEVAVANCK